jgi:hypothetical protein
VPDVAICRQPITPSPIAIHDRQSRQPVTTAFIEPIVYYYLFIYGF